MAQLDIRVTTFYDASKRGLNTSHCTSGSHKGGSQRFHGFKYLRRHCDGVVFNDRYTPLESSWLHATLSPETCPFAPLLGLRDSSASSCGSLFRSLLILQCSGFWKYEYYFMICVDRYSFSHNNPANSNMADRTFISIIELYCNLFVLY